MVPQLTRFPSIGLLISSFFKSGEVDQNCFKKLENLLSQTLVIPCVFPKTCNGILHHIAPP